MANKIAPHKGTLEQATEAALAAGAWDYDHSVKKIQSLVARWNGATLDVSRELYYAHEFLTTQQGQYKDPEADDYIAYTWKGYCEAIGLSVPTANRMARIFIPAPLSGTGEDRLLTDEEQKALKAPAITYSDGQTENRIALVMAGGPRPGDWTTKEERLVEERQERRRLEEVTTVFVEQKFDLVPRQDYIKNILSKTKELKQFRLKTDEQIRAQLRMFDAVDVYLKMFPDKESRLTAAANLTTKIRNAVNYLTERDIAGEQAEK
jgi:hypothetical protein